MDVKLFDCLCQRGNVWLRNMAETEFMAMLCRRLWRMARDEKKLDLGYGAQRTLSVSRELASKPAPEVPRKRTGQA